MIIDYETPWRADDQGCLFDKHGCIIAEFADSACDGEEFAMAVRAAKRAAEAVNAESVREFPK